MVLLSVGCRARANDKALIMMGMELILVTDCWCCSTDDDLLLRLLVLVVSLVLFILTLSFFLNRNRASQSTSSEYVSEGTLSAAVMVFAIAR